MIRSLAGRGLAGLALSAVLSSWGAPVGAQFTSDECLAADEQPIREGGTNGVRSVVTGDLDGDDDLDVVTASIGDDRIAWFENDGAVAPAAPGFMRNSISSDADGATAVVVADLNADGHLDVVSASSNDNKIAWYRNNGEPDPKFGEFQISTSALLAQSVFVADVNGDCEPDPRNGQPTAPCLDVLSASFEDNKIAWYENDGSDPPRFTESVISLEASGASSVHAADMDGDGDIDLLSTSLDDDKVAWYENDGQDPPAFTERVIAADGLNGEASTAVRPTSVVAVDLNADDAPDLVVAANGNLQNTGKILWFESQAANGGGLAFVAHDIKTGLASARQVFAENPITPGGTGSDLNGDTFIDVLAAYGDTIAWFQSDGAVAPAVPTFVEQVISPDELLGASSVHAADLDGDDLPDVQSGSSVPGVRIRDDRVLWYPNQTGFMGEIISINAVSPESIAIADINGDCVETAPGEPPAPCLDVVSASSVDDTIAWHVNGGEYPSPQFTRQEIDTSADSALSVFVADLDGSCSSAAACLDVVAAAPGEGTDRKIVWYQNDGVSPDTGFSDPFVILQEGPEVKPTSVFAADLDADGDNDVIAAILVETEGVPDRVSWFENDGTVPGFSVEHLISANLDGPRAVFADDVDSDGYVDVLAASFEDNRITWFRNLKGDEQPPTSDPPQWDEIIITSTAFGAMYVYVTDLDGDCDPENPSFCKEILSASGSDNKIAWYDTVSLDVPAEPAAGASGTSGAGSPGGGTADLAPGPEIKVTPETLDFGTTHLLGPETLPLLIENPGDETLSISAITSTTAEFIPLAETLEVEPGESEEIRVAFAPTAVEMFTGRLWFTSNAVTDPAPTVDMSGEGLEYFFDQHVITLNRLFARFVSAGDVDQDGLIDVLTASSGDGVIAAYLQQETDPDAEDPELIFQETFVSTAANDARVALASDLNDDGLPDVVTAYFFEISWHEGGIEESCNSFDVDDDQRLAGAELSWIWTAFGSGGSPATAAVPWWEPVDFNEDGLIDGDDLAIGVSRGVWTRYVNPDDGDPAGPLCSYSCVSQD